MKAPLEGVRVIEVAHYVAVPAAGALLADLGAEVIKVEQPPKGEIYRRTRPKYVGYDCDFSEHPPFQMDNRGKRSIMLDLTRPDVQKALLRVVDRADVLITNLLPERRRRYGLDHESLLQRSPGLVIGAISGYGLGGDEADRPAFDYAAYWARTGMMDTMRDEGAPPSLLRPGVGDHAAAMSLVCGILSALRMRDATGQGRYVDVSLLQTGLYIFGNDMANALVTREPVRKHNRTAPLSPLWNSYPVKGDRWILLVMIDADRYWPRFCGAIERPDLEHDSRYEDPIIRSQNSAELVLELDALFRTRTLEEWAPRLNEAGLIWSPVHTIMEAIEDPQAHALGYFPETDHRSAGTFTTVSPPFTMDGVSTSGPPADLNADGAEILREVGLDEGEIEKILTDE